ncbi:early placenta insulin-like peptide [Sciurus carolinensis]|uniref:early placenta insulin-like peptide n=1 Tax=Sciurus carolinensis TaxID=30640 RepID=UPI001FB35865|nr:early placenta insulin-like peptide [Sciurus carolinensis]
MASMFLSYLLGVWLLLAQFPMETTANSLSRRVFKHFCAVGFSRFELACRSGWQRDSSIHEEVTLQEGSLSDIPAVFSYRDVQALKTLSESNPDFPQDLKAAFSDSWSVLRNLQHSKDRGHFLHLFARICCYLNCAKNVKYHACGNNGNHFGM